MNKRIRPNNKPVSPFRKWRFVTVGVGIALLFVTLMARTAYIQVIEPDQLRYQGDLRSLRITTSFAERGSITDRNGEVLAVSVPVEAVWADPKQVNEAGSLANPAAWQALADVLDLSVDQLTTQMKNPKRRFIYLKRQVSTAVANYIRKLQLPGVYLRPESRRFYPTGEIDAQLLGVTNIDGKGISGVELSYNQWLTGSATERKVRKNRLGQVIKNIGVVQEGQQAHSLQLSIDQRIQSLAYRALKRATAYNEATSASLVMINIKTGEILAQVNTPSYNPNNRSEYRNSRARDRAITDSYEPGSTLKPLIMVSALEHGIVKPDSIIDTSPGWLTLGGHNINDEGRNYGKITLGQILQHSSNMGMTRIALRETPQQMLSTLNSFGIGNVSGLGLIGEVPGLMPLQRRWSQLEQATLSFGYGLTLTPLQLAHAYAILGSDGIRYPLSILKQDTPPKGERVIPKGDAKAVLDMLEKVVTRQGTGTKAAISGYRVAGKTGTSRKAVAGGYGNAYVALFAGVAPVSNPQLALAVVVNDPKGDRYYGGVVAAPIFSEVMSGALQLLNIRPDAEPSKSVTGTNSTQFVKQGDKSNAHA